MSATIDLLAQEVTAGELAIGDTLLFAAGEYPIRNIERLPGTVRVHFARVRPGLVDEHFGSMLFASAHPVRRLAR